jgi:hypothetical protein
MSFQRSVLGVLLALVTVIPAGLRAQVNAGAATTAAVPIPLGQYAQGQAMMAQAAKNVALLDVNFKFIDKSYDDNTYATDPLGNKYITSCYRFKATSGFRFKVDVPQFTLTPQGLTVTQNIAKLNYDGLSVKVRVLACQDIDLPSIGLHLSDLKVTYTARPMISFGQANGACTVSWNQDTDDVRITIGDLNILGVQNDVDKLAKDAVREALNLALDGFYGSLMRNELLKISTGVCGQPPAKAAQPAQAVKPPTRSR